MNTKTIMKSLAAAMLMPAMLLTTACSNSDDEIVNTENPTNTKGYALPVTINVTRQSDATRASYDGENKKLNFSAGDKLFVTGSWEDDDENYYCYAGMLDYVSDGTFSGTIITETEWTGTTEGLLGGASATLLPAGYEEYGYLSIADEGTYEAYLSENFNKAFATSKAAAVEQFSYELDNKYSSGFELIPANAILNFTINGLDASTEVDVVFSRSSWPEDIVVSGKVTTDGDGTATFAIGIKYGNNLKDCSLTVGGNAITLPANKSVDAGKIYNISRSVAPAASITNPEVGQIIGSDGKNYAADATLPTGVTKVAMIAYVNGSNGLAIQLSSSPESKNWEGAKTYAGGLNTSTPIAGGTWRLPSKEDWQNMFVGCAVSGDASASDSMKPIAGFKAKIAATGITWKSSDYWSSTPSNDDYAWRVGVYLNGSNALADFYDVDTSDPHIVLGCLAF